MADKTEVARSPAELLEENTRLRDVVARFAGRIGKLTASRDYPSSGGAELSAIRDPDAFYSRLIRCSIGAIHVYDLELRKSIYVNHHFTTLTGYTLAEINAMEGDEFQELLHPEDREALLAHLDGVSKAGDDRVHEIEYRFHHKTGGWVWLLAHDVPFERDGDGRVIRYLGSFIDVDAHKRTQEGLEQFVHMAAHDLRAPARRLAFYSDLALSDHAAQMAPELRSTVERIRRESTSLLELISDLRVLSGIRRLPGPGREPVELSELIAGVLEELGDEIRERRAQVVVDAHPEVSAYPGLLRPLYRNLVGNALRHGGPDMELRLSAETLHGQRIFGVRNTGSTIPKRARQRVFLPFVRVYGGEEGAGLGLSICEKAVAHHRGRIWVEASEERAAPWAWFKFDLGDVGG